MDKNREQLQTIKNDLQKQLTDVREQIRILDLNTKKDRVLPYVGRYFKQKDVDSNCVCAYFVYGINEAGELNSLRIQYWKDENDSNIIKDSYFSIEWSAMFDPFENGYENLENFTIITCEEFKEIFYFVNSKVSELMK